MSCILIWCNTNLVQNISANKQIGEQKTHTHYGKKDGRNNESKCHVNMNKWVGVR